ncbi:MAG: hypothetical protein WBR18_07275 [Anaerolineales bacterium]
MLTGTTLVLFVLIALVVIIVVLLALWRINVRRQIEKMPPATPPGMGAVRQAVIDPGEQEASLVSEQIESMVQAELAAYPELADAHLDFGTAADGSLVIWFQGEKYVGADQVPEPRLRQAIERAVETFNKRSSGTTG